MNNLKNEISLDKVAIVMSNGDNVATALEEIKKGTLLFFNSRAIMITNDIPKGYRFALINLGKGQLIKQYGYPFGVSRGIAEGEIVGMKDMDDYRDCDYPAILTETFHKGKRRLEFTDRELHRVGINRTFNGYIRRNGEVGTRNYYLIVPASLCASDVAAKIAFSLDGGELLSNKYKNIDGIVAAAHTEGCGSSNGEIIDRLLLTLKNTISHPNVGGVLIIDLGCEKTNNKVISSYLGDLTGYCKQIDFLSIQDIGGTGKAIEKGKSIVRNRLKSVDMIERKEVPLKHLIAGTECGASDSFSGITANPLIGQTVDKIIKAGGSAIMSEIPEMLGAERYLISRMTSKKVAEKFIRGINYYKMLAKRLNVDMDGNLVSGNVQGGLVNLTLKSLGASLKGGNTEIVDFLNYSEKKKLHGLTIMNGPGNDLESLTGIVAGGANIILFSTGMGATEGNLIVPVIKISSRTDLFLRMKEDMDFNAGRMLDDKIPMDKLSDDLIEFALKVASGEKTWSEIWKKRSFQVWTAGKLSL